VRRSTRPNRCRIPLGFTLIELLSVIAILSLVAGLATAGLAATTDSARLREVQARWRDLDAHGRLLARREGTVVMSVDEERRLVRLHLRSPAEPVASFALPRGVSGRIERDDGRVVFDALGRSPDYAFVVANADHTLRWQVAGLTGCITEVPP